MEQFISLQEARDRLNPQTLLMGNFDGVHLGHARLIAHAARLKRPLAALTFDPHPLEVMAPTYRLGRLGTTQDRVARLMALGVDGVIVLPFTREFAQIDPVDFLDTLTGVFDLEAVVIGEAFRFGAGRAGTTRLLQEHLLPRGVSVHVVPHFTMDGLVVSSTKIRQFLLEGDIPSASRFLGRAYGFPGVVSRGMGIGRTMGFPTANVRTPLLIPANGVYCGTCTVGEEILPAVISIGTRESIAKGLPREVEVHILDREMNLYNEMVTVRFLKRLRDQQTFPTREALVEAIAEDVRSVRRTVCPDA